jgi:electron transport complex protein RnfD
MAAATLADVVQSGCRRRFELADGSAMLTGLLIGFSMSAEVPFFVPAAASAFAILVVKGAFGGLGGNWMNPALAGITFAWINWPSAMAAPVHAPLTAALLPSILPHSIDAGVTSTLNLFPFSPLGATLPTGYAGMFLGFQAGRIGELSALLLLGASTILIGRRILRWQVPASIFLGLAVLEWVFGATGGGLFGGDPLGAVLSGPFFLIAFFMATDPVTSPSRRLPMVLYGLGIGAIAYLVRHFGAASEALVYAVLVMNCFVPLLEGIRRAPRNKEAGP